jgi:hypothetical protein
MILSPFAMKRRFVFLASCMLVGILPFTMFARNYDTSNLPYTDAPKHLPTAVAISVLTAEGVLQGDPGGTIRPQARMNRAEFVTIAMRLYERKLPRSTLAIKMPCFPDVPKGLWYTEKVCVAKALGIISGNDHDGLPPEQWPFEPNRAVQYEEVLKILFRIFALPTVTVHGGEWYEEYTNGAVNLDIHLPGVVPGDHIRRGDMAQLAAAFLAESEGELDLLRAAQEGKSSSSSSSSSSGASISSSSMSSSSGANSCQMAICPDGYKYPTCTPQGRPINYFADPCLTHGGTASSSVSSASSSSSITGTGALTDQYGSTTIRSGHLLLGTVSGVLGSAKMFPDSEPVDIRKITVTLVSPASSIESLLLFKQDGTLLGTASEISTAQYVLNLLPGTLPVPHREERSIYVRARIKSDDNGGTGGQDVQVHSFQIEGFGDWSNNKYITATTETFLPFETAAARLTSITQTGDTTGPLIAGDNQLLGIFRFEAERSDPSLHPRLTTLVFNIESSGVTLSDAYLRIAGGSEQHSCTISSSTLTCSTLNATMGSLDAPLSLQLFADVTIHASTGGFVRVVLNEPGTPTTTGDITWTDGSTTFQWVPMNRPVARGTYFTR